MFGTPTTAHILGGACMGRPVNGGVIDVTWHRGGTERGSERLGVRVSRCHGSPNESGV
jgi:hypothetical protein